MPCAPTTSAGTAGTPELFDTDQAPTSTKRDSTHAVAVKLTINDSEAAQRALHEQLTQPRFPDDPGDPWVFRVEIPEYGQTHCVAFNPGAENGGAPTRFLMDVLSFQKRPDARNPRRLVNGAHLAGATAITVRPRH